MHICPHVIFSVLVTLTTCATFGHDARKHFFMKEGYVNLNHGSFGTTCRAAGVALQESFIAMEKDSNKWFRGGYQPLLKQVRSRLAHYVSSDESDLVIVENASVGVNSVLRSLAAYLPLGTGDVFVHMDIAYPMVKNVANYLASVHNFTVVSVPISFPIDSDQDFITPIHNVIHQYGSRIKVMSLDHISSYPSCILPIKDLVRACHDNNIIVMVDGAHALGQISLNVSDIGADFYTANAHKWMYSPKGSAFLWVAKKWQNIIKPAVISDAGPNYVSNFEYTGTRDYNNFLAINEAMDFRSSIGDVAIMIYMHDVVWKGAHEVAKIWNTSVLTRVESMNAALVSVYAPCSTSMAFSVRQLLTERYDTYIQPGGIGDRGYVRLSGQIYLEVSDYTTMAYRFLELMTDLY
jgi:selenocysteine lyase/cysteine desulfurase